TPWFVTRNVSTPDTDCADARPAHITHAATNRIAVRLLAIGTVFVLGDGDARRLHRSVRLRRAVDGHLLAGFHVVALAAAERRGRARRHERGADDEAQ